MIVTLFIFATGHLTSFICHELGHYVGLLQAGVPKSELTLRLTSVGLSANAVKIIDSKTKLRQIIPIALGPICGMVGGLIFVAMMIPKKYARAKQLCLSAIMMSHISQFLPLMKTDGELIASTLYKDKSKRYKYIVIFSITLSTSVGLVLCYSHMSRAIDQLFLQMKTGSCISKPSDKLNSSREKAAW
jgi:hypothetical protein